MTTSTTEPTSTPKVAVNDIGGEDEFLAAVDETIKYFNDGDIVEGVVVKVDRDEVLLDIGYKTEGVIPSRELSIKHDIDPNEVVSVGDHVEAHHPHAELAQPGERARDAADEGHREVFDRSGCGLGDGRRDVHGPMPRQHDACRTGAGRTAKKRAEVAGVGEAVRTDQKRRCSIRAASLRELVELDLTKRRCLGEHTLRRFGARFGHELVAAHLTNGHAHVARELEDLLDHRGVVEIGRQPDLAHTPPAKE